MNKTTMIIQSQSDVTAGIQALLALDPSLAPLLDVAGPPPLRLRTPGFAGLAGIVVAQQVSVASARAIWARMEARLPAIDCATMLAAGEEALRACGLSGPKIRGLQPSPRPRRTESCSSRRWRTCRPTRRTLRLCAVRGVGPWTADVYLLFCLGHADAFAAGDLALQEAARMGFALERRPDGKTLLARAEAWRPWRGIAARLLWAYYAAMKRREGAPLTDAP